MFRKRKSAVEGDPKKGRSGSELNKKRWGWRLAWWGSNEKKKASHLLGLRGRHQYSDQRSSRIRATCVASTSAGTEGEEDQMASLSA